jgi:hypothetical protein
MSEQANLQRTVAVNRDRQTYRTAGAAIYVMTTVDPKEPPTASLDEARELASGQLPHTAISKTRSLPPGFGSSRSTDKQPSTAS